MPDVDLKPSGVQTRIHFSLLSRRAAFLLDRKWPWLLVAFAVVFLVWTVTFDIRRPMWNDEILTFYVSQQPTLSGVWKALMTGADQQPPAFYLVIRAFTA